MDEKKQPNDLLDLGGYEMITKVNKAFYDLVYKHPWMSLYFQETPQKIIESQQSDFIFDALGGYPKKFRGRLIRNAHTHLMITEELFILRGEMLQTAFNEVGAPALLATKWTKIDESFKNVLVKKSLSECEKRFFTDEILDFPNPQSIKKVA